MMPARWPLVNKWKEEKEVGARRCLRWDFTSRWAINPWLAVAVSLVVGLEAPAPAPATRQDDEDKRSKMIDKSEELDEWAQRPATTGGDAPKAEKKSVKINSRKIQQHQPQVEKFSSNMGGKSGPSQAAELGASLHSASREGKLELVRLLLRCGADVNAQDQEFGNTALHLAAWNGFSETVQVLCKHRANTSIRNKAHFAPLHMACQQGHNQSARLLLMAGAKTEAKNSYGDTPLHTAARYGHAGVARILLSARSEPNQVNKNHDTPLHIAAAMGRRKLTRIFMQNGAEPAIKNKQNETAMDIALRKDLIDIQELIANPPPPPTSSRPRPAHARCGRHAHLRQGSCERAGERQRSGLELAVDVPAAAAATAGSPPPSGGIRPRPKTLTMGAAGELHLLSRQRQLLNTCSSLELRPTQPDCPLAPDARAHQQAADWAKIMERSARSFKAKTLDAAAAVRASPEVARQANQRRRKCSPTNSVRSSLASRSRGRLVLGPRASRQRQCPSRLVRRPNLGTCVGKLSLLRLRNLMAARTSASSQELARAPEEAAAQGAREEEPRAAPGRRQQRLERLQREQAAGRRALNGGRLSATRPLAPLNDETQLYAIPKKIGPLKASLQPASNGAAGPALTSDGCHSSLSSLNRAATPLSSILSSADEGTAAGAEEPAVVGVHTSGPAEPAAAAAAEQADLAAPGYSAIGQQMEPAECRCDQEEPAKRAASKLRSLFQFSQGAGSKPKVAASAIAGGYYAYSPVVQSSSELRRWQQQQQRRRLESPTNGSPSESNKKLPTNNGRKCSWLKSKFSSTSKSNLDEGESKAEREAAGGEPQLAGPERRAELIRVNGEDQIQPKGSLSAASAELIAAQKSLAAAAAAKVRRTRQALGVCREEEAREEEEEDAEAEAEAEAAAAAQGGQLRTQVGMLTVKTGDELGLHRQWSPAGQKYLMIGRANHLGAGSRNGGGSGGGNSVGMSDSSPSNNGADSDNSMQTATTTGSLNADNSITSNGQADDNSSPLGILSRILLNNHNNHKSYAARKSPRPASPAGSQSPATTKAPAQLDKLGSRSRCPIVVATSKSDELPLPPPPLPAKSALKPAGSFQTPPLKAAPSKSESGLLESMNGLPRVASYSQISSLAGQQPHYRPASHMAAPYLPYAPHLGRCSQPVDSLKYQLGRHHLSHHDLSFDSSPMPPTAAINYEYYLEAPLAGSFAGPQRYHFMSAAGDALYAPPAAYDDSIYIPAAYKHHYQLEMAPIAQYQQQQQPRPKSSLDNFHLPRQTTLETTNGLQRQISATIDHKQQTDGKMRAAYYSYSSSSPYNQHQGLADNYLYTSENSIYASDRAFHTPGSHLTVLPTCDQLPYHRAQSSSTTSSASPMKQLGAVGGGQDGDGASPGSTEGRQRQQHHHEGSSSSSPAASTSSAVSSLLSSPAQRPAADAGGPPTPMARQQQEQQRNSWTPTAGAPFKSLVQINQPASSLSCDGGAVNAQQAKSHQSSQSATAAAATSDPNPLATMTDLPLQVVSSVNGRSHLQLNGQSSDLASKQTKVVISNGNNYSHPSPTTITANNCQLPEHCNGSTTNSNKTVL